MKKKILIACIIVIQSTSVFASIPVVTSKNDTATTYVSKEDEVMVKNALESFKSLSKAERKARIADAKALLKNYKADKANKASGEPSTSTVLLAILAILLPPLAVYLHENAINSKFWISILLTLLFWIPGVIYALFVIFA
jgi:uncharacterized membrane protein YqaE (UPF0057 family)